jgi:hypothetical protein
LIEKGEKMTLPVKQRIIQALEGETPSPLPFVSYTDFTSQDPAWEGLEELGFGWLHYINPYRIVCPVAERVVTRETRDNRTWVIETIKTSLGELRKVVMDGWTQEYFLKTPADYRVAEYITRNTTVEPLPEVYAEAEAWLGERGIPLVYIGRSPYQTVLVDWAGLENFSYHLADGFPQFFALLEAMEDLSLATAQVATQLPGRYISLLENLTADQVGPRRFKSVHLPYYEKLMLLLHGAGKKVYFHLDGKLKSLVPLLTQAGFDGIDSLTEPPEGDITLEEARAAWPETCFWANINVGLYQLPPRALQATVRRMAYDAGPDGRRLIFEVSEDLPENWRESLPVVLEALNSVQ